MMRLLLGLLMLGIGMGAPMAKAAVDAGRFQVLHTKLPPGTPLGIAFVISDINGWDATAEATTAALQADGWLAVGINLARYRESLQHGTDACHDVGDELIGLSQHLQRELGIATYLTPVLVGYGQGGVLAYATIKQALPNSFLAGVGVTDKVRLDLPKQLCDGPPAKKTATGYKYDLNGLLKAPFTFNASLRAEQITPAIKHYQKQPVQNSIADLPLVPMAPLSLIANSTGFTDAGNAADDTFIVFISGDGGWRDLDKTIAEALHKQGFGVVGWDSLRYFWTQKTPEQLASDLGRVMTHYAQAWHKPKIALIGYSFGADAIPFAYNRLPLDLQQQVAKMELLGLGKEASFEIEVEGYIGLDGNSDRPLAPELIKLPGEKILCMAGEDDIDDSSCLTLKQKSGTEVIITAGGHHFDEDYNAVATKMLQAIR